MGSPAGRVSSNKGRKLSEETKQRMRESHLASSVAISRRKFTDKEKWCNHCSKWLLLDDFGPNKCTASGKQDYCKTCVSEYFKRVDQRLHRQLCKHKMTLDQFQGFLKKQDEKCAICGNPFSDRPDIDHDHETGEPRGLLCGTCNRGLGQFKDQISLLEKAIVYLKAFSNREV